MDEKNGITKEGLNNVFETSRPLTRSEALRKYNALSPKAREEVNGWVNRAFYLKTGFPSNQKIDPKNPEHVGYVEEWLKQRDYVMGWSRNWERSAGNLNTRIFRENIPPTSPEVLRRKTGIFEQRMTPKEFNIHVVNRLHEAAAYDGTSTMLEGRRKIATNIAEKLFSNQVWVQNALRTKEGRNGLHSLLTWIEWVGSGSELGRGLNDNQKELASKLHTILDPYLPTEIHESVVKQHDNRSLFYQNFPTLKEHIKKGLEKEGFQVGEIYHRVFTGGLIEIRAETTRQTKVDQTSYGTRGDPYVTPVITEKRDISVGGVDVRTGVYHDAAFFEKHGTAKTDWGTQLMLGEVAVLAGLGVRALVLGTQAVVVGGRRTVLGTTERIVGRELRDSLDDITGASVRTGDTLPGIGPQRRRVKIGTSDDPADAFADTIKLTDDSTDAFTGANVRTGDTLPGIGPQRRSIKNGTSDEATSTLSETIPPRLDVDPQLVRNLSDDVLSTLGEDLSSRALFYGYNESELTNHIIAKAQMGLTQSQVRQDLDKILQVHDALYELTYRSNLDASRRAMQEMSQQSIMVDTRTQVRVSIRASEGNITSAISSQRFGDKLAEWHRINDFPDGVANVPGSRVMRRIAQEATKFANRIEAQIMGGSSAGGFIMFKDTKLDKETLNLRNEAAQKKPSNDQKGALPQVRDKAEKIETSRAIRDKKIVK
jgi:hypothetical protein